MPTTDIDRRYGDEIATALPWDEAEKRLAEAEVAWLSTVKPDGQPHVTPLITVWHNKAAHFVTGAQERKARNLAKNSQVVLTVGNGTLHDGLDVVLEGRAVRVVDQQELQKLADAWEAKYGAKWRFELADGGFANPSGVAYVFSN